MALIHFYWKRNSRDVKIVKKMMNLLINIKVPVYISYAVYILRWVYWNLSEKKLLANNIWENCGIFSVNSCTPSPHPPVVTRILTPPHTEREREREEKSLLAKIHSRVSYNITPLVISHTHYSAGGGGLNVESVGGGRVNRKHPNCNFGEPERKHRSERKLQTLVDRILQTSTKYIIKIVSLGALRQLNFWKCEQKTEKLQVASSVKYLFNNTAG